MGKYKGCQISDIPFGDLLWYADNYSATLLGKLSRQELDKRLRSIFGEKTMISRSELAITRYKNQIVTSSLPAEQSDIKNNLLTNYEDYD